MFASAHIVASLQGRKSMFKHEGGGGGVIVSRNKWCCLVHLVYIYLDKISSLKNFKNYYFLYNFFYKLSFFYKNFKTYHFLYNKMHARRCA